MPAGSGRGTPLFTFPRLYCCSARSRSGCWPSSSGRARRRSMLPTVGANPEMRMHFSYTREAAWYSSANCSACLLAVLLLANVFNYMDRSLIGTLADPIGRDLRISDTELGIIGGLAF